MNRIVLVVSVLIAGGAIAPPAHAFCGFYVSKGDSKIFNKASKVVLARDGDRTVLTMVSDYQGDPKEFAVVIPVPVVLQKQQVHIGDPAWVDHLDAYSAPRLVEYFDPNPCPNTGIHVVGDQKIAIRSRDSSTRQLVTSADLRAVTIEAQFKVDEYEIVILSATEGRALDRWLTENGYRIPPGAAPVLQSYIRQKVYFFVAKVDVKEQERLGFKYLRPIQVAFESPKFMLPLRLGMANSSGVQEMFVFTLTRRGLVEATNYRTVRLPTGQDVPEFVKTDFADFYRLLFANQHRRERESAVFLEYAWVVVPNTPSCDPCVAPYLTPVELRSLGAYWITTRPGNPGDAVLTRLHLRYDNRHFPEDLVLHETADRVNWQARYVLHHPWRGTEECSELAAYRKGVWERRRGEAENYAALTGTPLENVRRRLEVDDKWSERDERLIWWERIWK